MGKKGKRKKKGKKSNGEDTLPPHTAGAAPGRSNLGMRKQDVKHPDSLREQDSEYLSYVARSCFSSSMLSQHFVKATELAKRAFDLVSTRPQEASKAAALLADAYMTDERGTSKAMMHLSFQLSGSYEMSPVVTKYLSPMIESLPNEDSLTGNIIIYWLCKAMGKPPAELLEFLDKCTTDINQRDGDISSTGFADVSIGINHATIHNLKALEFTALGRSRKARSLMIKAAKVGRGGMSGWTALWNLCCIKQVGCTLEAMSPDTIAQDVVDLKLLLKQTQIEDRYHLGLLMRLCNIYVVCGNIDQAHTYRNQMEETIEASNALHPPLDRAPIEGRIFFNSLFEQIDCGSTPPVSLELKAALEIGVIDASMFKMNFNVEENDKADNKKFDGGDDTSKKKIKKIKGRSSEISDRNDPARLNTEICICCGEPSQYKCSRCKCVQYCGELCQKKHWKEGGHKKACQTLKKVNAGVKIVGWSL